MLLPDMLLSLPTSKSAKSESKSKCKSKGKSAQGWYAKTVATCCQGPSAGPALRRRHAGQPRRPRQPVGVSEVTPRRQDGGGGAGESGQRRRDSGGGAAEAEPRRQRGGGRVAEASESAGPLYRELGGQ